MEFIVPKIPAFNLVKKYYVQIVAFGKIFTNVRCTSSKLFSSMGAKIVCSRIDAVSQCLYMLLQRY